MNNLQDTLLGFAGSCLNGKDFGFDQVNWAELMALSAEQGVTGVVFSEIERRHKNGLKLPIEVTLNLYAYAQQIEKQNIKVNSVLYKLARVLNQNHIPFVLLKGQGLAQLYPQPLRRASGDIDLYIGTEKYEVVRNLFIEFGWMTGKEEQIIKHWEFHLDGVLVEMHCYSAVIPYMKANHYFQNWMMGALADSTSGFFVNENGEAGVDSGEEVRMLPPVENTVFTFVHLMTHFIAGEMSLRQLMDVAICVRQLQRDGLTKELEQHLKKIGYLRSWQVFSCIMVKCLGFNAVDFPCYNSKHEDKAETILQFMFDEAHKRSEKRGDRSYQHGLWNKTKHYTEVCTHHFKLFRLFPKECFGSFCYMLADVSTKRYNRSKHSVLLDIKHEGTFIGK